MHLQLANGRSRAHCWVQGQWPRSRGVCLSEEWKGWASAQGGLFGGKSPPTPPRGGRGSTEKRQLVCGVCSRDVPSTPASPLTGTGLTVLITFPSFPNLFQAWLLFKQNFKEVFSMLYFL